MKDEKIWTVLEILNWTADYFKQRGIKSARLDAELLLAKALNLSRLQLYLNFDRPLTQDRRESFKALLKRRAAFEPVAYILGEKEFLSRPFMVTPACLIPRPETELLVERVIEIGEGRSRPVIVELGTGSGAIAISLKLALDCRIYAADVSVEALQVAALNAKRLGAEGEINFITTNLFAGLKDIKADIIVSNPPYVPTAEWASLPEEIKGFEPRLALDGGQDGLKTYRRIINEAGNYLKKNGCLALELGAGLASKVKGLVEEKGLFSSLETVKDYAGHTRILLATINN